MANAKLKTEMTGTGGTRRDYRAVVKRYSRRLRRERGKAEAREGKAAV